MPYINRIDRAYMFIHEHPISKKLIAILMDTPIKLDFFLLKKTAIIFRALNHRLRQQILLLLQENPKLTVSQIYEKLHLEQSVASQHLAIMRRAGIVKTERNKKFVYYKLNNDRIAQIDRSIKELL